MSQGRARSVSSTVALTTLGYIADQFGSAILLFFITVNKSRNARDLYVGLPTLKSSSAVGELKLGFQAIVLKLEPIDKEAAYYSLTL